MVYIHFRLKQFLCSSLRFSKENAFSALKHALDNSLVIWKLNNTTIDLTVTSLKEIREHRENNQKGNERTGDG